MKLFDTLSSTYKLLPKVGTVTIYNCGPTLYNRLHLGNLRPILTFDFLIRYLREKKISYKYVLNLTDIDEKIILKAQSEDKSISEVVGEYTYSFLSILDNLGIIYPDNFPRVSDNIDNIQLIISSLLNCRKAK
ncbi:hypothetical protein PVNG_02492 [Plasmodium vivax North Korean]|uniref:tRNA synthetases class I catalytic domain-containing protein n=1 Tax=Plasmodium vivax North Korean TaxID=1035514 RepID=A0A0J9W6W6_PLAVI|nr:hypothetical protein PVNG_02492 [Plasmodium vivax North Korean]